MLYVALGPPGCGGTTGAAGRTTGEPRGALGGHEGRRAPAARAEAPASPATVGSSKKVRIEISAPRTERTRLSSRTADREWPPRSKKSSSMPTSATPRTSTNRVRRMCSRGLRGARVRAARAVPSGVPGPSAVPGSAPGCSSGCSSGASRRAPSWVQRAVRPVRKSQEAPGRGWGGTARRERGREERRRPPRTGRRGRPAGPGADGRRGSRPGSPPDRRAAPPRSEPRPPRRGWWRSTPPGRRCARPRRAGGRRRAAVPGRRRPR